MVVARSFSGRVTKSQGERAILKIVFLIDNALHNIAFGTHTKMAEPTEMPFGRMSGLGPRNCVTWVDDFRRRRDNLGENMFPTNSSPYELQIGLVYAAVCTRRG